MKPRYLIGVSHDRTAPSTAAKLARASGLNIVYDRGSLAALTNPACRCYAVAGAGLVLGTLFHRHGPASPIGPTDQLDATRLFAGRGEGLLAACWGGFIAAFHHDEIIEVLREPSGALPCFYAVTPTMTLLASDVDLLVASGQIRPVIGRWSLARQLWRGNLPTAETVLAGVNELLPGHSIEITDRASTQRRRWSPWTHVAAEGNDRADQAARLRRAVTQAVRGWSAAEERLLVSVSGGLDSAIVAACLAQAGRDVRCLTLYADDPTGDERSYARALCAHLGLPLVERRYEVEAIDLSKPLAPHLPRPIGRSHEQAYERAHLDVARDIGADAFVTGNGGDNVFGYSQSAGAIADRLRSEGLSVGVLRTLGDVCQQTGCGPVEAIGAALRLWRQTHYHWRPVPMFLEPAICTALAAEGLSHPWLDSPASYLPGKAGHVAALLRIQQVLEPGRSTYAPVRHPLLSQPVVETCLAIPSWQWREGGIDRAVARAAFAGDLPDAVAWRRTKGGPDAFCAQVVTRHRAQIAERLLDGRLAGLGLVDRAALEATLCRERQITSDENVRILDLVDTEAWLSSWTGRVAPPTVRHVPTGHL